MQSSIGRRSTGLLDEECYCPAPHEAGDILYPGSDSEETTDEIAQKRARYEAHAQRYLRGHVPIINSAKLRGPFDNNWINPWRYKPHRDNGRHVAQDHSCSHPHEIVTTTRYESEYILHTEAMPCCRDDAGVGPCMENGSIREVSGLWPTQGETSSEKESSIAASSRSSANTRGMGLVGQTSQYQSHQDHDASSYINLTHPFGTKAEHRSSSKLSDRCPDDEVRVLKRTVDSLWLKGSYPSKRARWESSADISPSPVVSLEAVSQLRQTKRINKSLPSGCTPSHVVSSLRTPRADSSNAQHNITHTWGTAQERPNLHINLKLDLEDARGDSLCGVQGSVKNQLNAISKTNIDSRPSIVTSPTSCLALPVTSSPLLEQDISFITEVAPSSRNMEKFEFRKKRKRKSRPSSESMLENEHIDDSANPVDLKMPFPKISPSDVESSYIASESLGSLDHIELASNRESLNQIDALPLAQSLAGSHLKKLVNLIERQIASPNTKEPGFMNPQNGDANALLGLSSNDSHSDQMLLSRMHLAAKADRSISSIRTVEEQFPDTLPNYTKDLQNARLSIGVTSIMPLLTPTKKTAVFSLDTPAKLSPFAMEFCQELGDSEVIVEEDDTPEVTGVADLTAASLKFMIQSATGGIQATKGIDCSESTCPEEKCSTLAQELQPETTLDYSSSELSLGSEEGESVSLSNEVVLARTPIDSIMQEHNKPNPTSKSVDNLSLFLHNSPNLPTPRASSTKQRNVSALKAIQDSGRGADSSTQSWNSSQVDFSRSPDITDNANDASGAYDTATEVVEGLEDEFEDEEENTLKGFEVTYLSASRELSPNITLDESDRSRLETRPDPQSPWTKGHDLLTPRLKVSTPKHAQLNGIVDLLPHGDATFTPTNTGWQEDITLVIPVRHNSQKTGQDANTNKRSGKLGELCGLEDSSMSQPPSRPSTPDLGLVGIVPFANFMTPTPPPRKSTSQVKMEAFPDTQQAIEATTHNPWTSVLKNTLSRKSGKRVSFGLSPSAQTKGCRKENSSTPSRRLLRSPPPQPLDDSENEDIFDYKATRLRVFDDQFLAPDGVGGYRPKLRESPLKPLASPIITGMAEAFVTADRDEPENKPRLSFTNTSASRRSKAGGRASISSPRFVNVWDSSQPLATKRSDVNTHFSMEYNEHHETVTDYISGFLGDGGILEEWSVDTELKRTNSTHYASDRPKVFGSSTDFRKRGGHV